MDITTNDPSPLRTDEALPLGKSCMHQCHIGIKCNPIRTSKSQSVVNIISDEMGDADSFTTFPTWHFMQQHLATENDTSSQIITKLSVYVDQRDEGF